jgi:uncharacterized protein (DUF2147 family)
LEKIMKPAWMLFLSLAAIAQAAASPVGLWRTVDPETRTAESLVRIVETPAGLSGRIERVLDPAKATARCAACGGARKDQPVQGMAIIEGVRRHTSGRHWDGGSILDPKNGKTYKVRLTPLDGGKRLEVRGMLGPFHRDQFWERVE